MTILTHKTKTRTRLRLHIEEPTGPSTPNLEEVSSLHPLCRSFKQATGWTLQCCSAEKDPSQFVWSQQVSDVDGDATNLLTLEGPPHDVDSPALCDFDDVRDLAASVGGLVEELHHARHAIWQREAELAAGVPITHHVDEGSHLATRLEAVLKAGAQAVECQAAAAYLLDEGTKQLKLRSCWGLPKSRFLEAPRPLRGAAADLEALVGHAVVLEDTRLLRHWSVPESFGSAVCVPISSPTTPLGTLWLFCEQPREFTDDETNLLEIVAGRVAADLEREVLLQQSVQTRTLKRQLTHAMDWQRNRLPQIKPLLDGWEVAGWTSQGDRLGGDFHDWFVLPDGSLAIAVGDAQGKMFEAALTAASLHTALKSHTNYRHTAQQMLDRINETLWTASAGDQFASMFYAVIQPDGGEMQYAAAGPVYAAVVGDSSRKLAVDDGVPLGTQPDAEYSSSHDELATGEILVVLSEGLKRTLTPASNRQLWRQIRRDRDCSADDLVDRIRSFVQSHVDEAVVDDQTVLVVKRRTRSFDPI